MNLFQTGVFTLSSGAVSTLKIECDALTDEDIKTIAAQIQLMVKPFSSVEGIPRGGLRLAKALEEYIDPLSSYHLLVDDVLTTGNSMAKASNSAWKIHQKFAEGAVIFARGPCPEWIKAFCQLPPELWLTRKDEMALPGPSIIEQDV